MTQIKIKNVIIENICSTLLQVEQIIKKQSTCKELSIEEVHLSGTCVFFQNSVYLLQRDKFGNFCASKVIFFDLLVTLKRIESLIFKVESFQVDSLNELVEEVEKAYIAFESYYFKAENV